MKLRERVCVSNTTDMTSTLNKYWYKHFAVKEAVDLFKQELKYFDFLNESDYKDMIETFDEIFGDFEE